MVVMVMVSYGSSDGRVMVVMLVIVVVVAVVAEVGIFVMDGCHRSSDHHSWSSWWLPVAIVVCLVRLWSCMRW